jgi:uncharacterized protein (DUF1697 family)
MVPLMTWVVAFLRGINVGGHVVKKEALLQAFAALGYRNAVTFKQSGNVVFETDESDLEATRSKIERRLGKALGYDVGVFIRPIARLRELAGEGSRFRLGEGTSLMVTMLPSPTRGPLPRLPLTIPRSTARVAFASGSEVFSLTHGGGEGGLPNQFLEARLKAKTTTRNMNVILEIVQKYG